MWEAPHVCGSSWLVSGLETWIMKLAGWTQALDSHTSEFLSQHCCFPTTWPWAQYLSFLGQSVPVSMMKVHDTCLLGLSSGLKDTERRPAQPLAYAGGLGKQSLLPVFREYSPSSSSSRQNRLTKVWWRLVVWCLEGSDLSVAEEWVPGGLCRDDKVGGYWGRESQSPLTGESFWRRLFWLVISSRVKQLGWVLPRPDLGPFHALRCPQSNPTWQLHFLPLLCKVDIMCDALGALYTLNPKGKSIFCNPNWRI